MVFRRATLKDIPAIMKFIDLHWKKNHIISRNRSFFEWQYVMDQEVNFVIALNEEDTIVGINGFIPYNHLAVPDIAGSIWKVVRTDNPILGLQLSEVLCNIIPRRFVSAPGLSRRAYLIEKYSHNPLGELAHYYIQAPKTCYHIAHFPMYEDTRYLPIPKNMSFRQITDVVDFEEALQSIPLEDSIPYKDEWYYVRRFWNHPVYHYEIYQVSYHQKKLLYVTREVEANGAKALKLVEVLGDYEMISYTGGELRQLLCQKGYEFVDLYSYGVPDDVLKKAGFQWCDPKGEVIVPNYFEPYVCENIPLYFTTNSHELLTNPHFHLFRADGDQDRPS